MKIKIQGRFLVLAALSLSATFCAPKKPPVDESSRANSLINEGRYNEAIAILDPAVRTNPQDQRSRLLLASAYAGQAGIFLSSYMGLAQELVMQTRSPDAEIINTANVMIYDRLRASAGSPEARKVIDVAQSVFVASVRIKTIIAMFNAVPNVKSPQALENIQIAIQILDGDEYVGGPALYRGLLRLVVAKHFLTTKLRLESFNQCRVNFHFLADQIVEARKYVRPIYNDLILGIIDPARKEPLIQAAARFDADTENAIQAIRTVGNTGAVNLAFIYEKLKTQCGEGKP